MRLYPVNKKWSDFSVVVVCVRISDVSNPVLIEGFGCTSLRIPVLKLFLFMLVPFDN